MKTETNIDRAGRGCEMEVMDGGIKEDGRNMKGIGWRERRRY
jgi:hypothetical protein